MTMTKVPTDVVFDLLVVEQLQDVVPCGWMENDSCPNPARWVLRCPVCGDAAFHCSEHRAALDGEPSVCCEEGHERYDFPTPLPWVAL